MLKEVILKDGDCTYSLVLETVLLLMRSAVKSASLLMELQPQARYVESSRLPWDARISSFKEGRDVLKRMYTEVDVDVCGLEADTCHGQKTDIMAEKGGFLNWAHATQ